MVCSIARISGARGRYYLNHYYNEELGEQGWFAGSGAEHFGIENDHIQRKDYRLENLLDGKTPDGTKKLKLGGDTPRIYPGKIPGQTKSYKKLSGFDFCLSDPKSLSVLDHLANNGEVSNEIERCRDVAQQAAMDYISDFCNIRKKTRDENGKEIYINHKAAVTFACFQHHLSRELDPQSHRHLLLMSGAVGLNDPNIRGSLDTKDFYAMQHTVGEIYRSTLRHELETGKMKLKTFDVVLGKGKSFGITGVPPSLCRELSTRSRQIEAEIEKNPTMSGAEVQAAVLKTRKKKQKYVDMSAVQGDWEEKGRKHGFKLSKICPALVKKSKPAKVIDLKKRLEEKQQQAKEVKHYAAMASKLRNKEDVTFHQVMTASLRAGDKNLSSTKAKEYAENFVSKYTKTRQGGGRYGSSDRHSLKHEAYTLPESSRTMTDKAAHAATVLINWQKMNRRAVINKHRAGADKRAKRFERKALGLFLMGRIGRVQYLACKARSPYEGKEFKLEVYHALHLISTKQKERLMAMGRKRESTPYIVKMALKNGQISQHAANILLRQDREKVLKEKEKEARERELKANQKKERNQERLTKVRSFGGFGR